MKADDDAAKAIFSGNALFQKMRARAEAENECWEAEWTEREAQRAADERAARVRSRSA